MKGSLIISDLTTIPSCSTADKVGDGSMLRLLCPVLNMNEDVLFVDPTIIDENIISAYKSEDSVTYILLNTEVPGSDLEVYKIVSDVIMNYDASSVVDIKLYHGDGGRLTIKDVTTTSMIFLYSHTVICILLYL